MLRRTAQAVARVLVVALWLGLVALLLRSYWRLDEWSRATSAGQVQAICSYRGALHFIACGNSAGQRPWSHDVHRIGADRGLLNLHPGIVVWQRLGFARLATAAPPRQGTVIPRSVVAGRTAAPPRPALLIPWLVPSPYDGWVLPYWPAILLVSLLPAMWIFRVARRRWRRRCGLCPTCGYDLRASAVKCPECGGLVPPNLRRRSLGAP